MFMLVLRIKAGVCDYSLVQHVIIVYISLNALLMNLSYIF